MNKAIIIGFLFCFAAADAGFAQDNPFFTKSSQEQEKLAADKDDPSLLPKLMNAISSLQRELNSHISTISAKIRENGNISLFILLTGIALFYGIIHAFGPGHGKIIMISYAMSNPLKIRQGIILGVFIAVIHTLSAILLVSLIYLVLNGTYTAYSQEPKRIISMVSYGLISGMGVFLFIRSIINIGRGTKREADQAIITAVRVGGMRNLVLPALAIGLVPCEGAVLILIYTISINAYWLGIILAIAMSAGMAFTISLMGLAAIYSKQGITKLIPTGKKAGKIVSILIQLLGALFIISFGSLLLFSEII